MHIIPYKFAGGSIPPASTGFNEPPRLLLTRPFEILVGAPSGANKKRIFAAEAAPTEPGLLRAGLIIR
jgi:hypothetical protein